MAQVDAYAPCPCGSGQKFKWCCQKVESYVTRADRMVKNGQFETALRTLDDGLRQAPGNPWLLLRKAELHLDHKEYEEARGPVEQVLARHPHHGAANLRLLQILLNEEGGRAALTHFYQVLGTASGAEREGLNDSAKLLILTLPFLDLYQATLRLLRCAEALGVDPEDVAGTRRSIQERSTVTPWMKQTYELSEPPPALAGEPRERFEQARAWADQHLLLSAAAAFETLSADGVGPEADRNLALCRLWLADHDGAAAALLRCRERLAPGPEAVDLEALRQQILTTPEDQLVEEVQLSWPLRDREALLARLRNEPLAALEQEDGALDPEDPEAPTGPVFLVLSRPPAKPDSGRLDDFRSDEIPRILGRLLVGDQAAIIETYDDGRLDGLTHWLTGLAGDALVPAHPKTTVVDKTTQLYLRMTEEWVLPPDLPPTVRARLSRDRKAEFLEQTWPDLPQPALNGRTPLQAAAQGDSEVALRALVCQLEVMDETLAEDDRGRRLRERLGIPPEPEIGPEDAADLERVPLARLHDVAAERLPDAALIAMFDRAAHFSLLRAGERAARALVGRPAVWEAGGNVLQTYAYLAMRAAARGQTDEALDWIARGRQADPDAARPRNAAEWDMWELRVRVRIDPAEEWVRRLREVFDRYGSDTAVMPAVISHLIDLRLVDVVPNPDDPDKLVVDSTPLQALFQRYGPRVMTGAAGGAATRPEIWTPGGPASGAGAGGIWTPGSGTPGAGSESKSRLILPGR